MNVNKNEFCLCSQILILHAYMCEQFKTTCRMSHSSTSGGIHVHVSHGFLELREYDSGDSPLWIYEHLFCLQLDSQ